MVDKDFAYSFLNRDASVVDSMLLQKLEHSFRLSVIAAMQVVVNQMLSLNIYIDM